MKFLIVILFLLSSCSNPDTEKNQENGTSDKNGTTQTSDTNVTPGTPDPAEKLYTISFVSLGRVPNSVKLTTQGKTLLILDSNLDSTCVALNQSELATLSIEVYNYDAPPSFLVEECSCNNNQGSTRRPCTTKLNHHAIELSGKDHYGRNWHCDFGVQTKELPIPSTCKRFQ